MNKILNIYKPIGLTPLQLIEIVRKNMPELKDEKIGYAGRLDPMAHGVMLLMVGGEATKERDKYLGLKKSYEFEVLFGVETDTYDVLGLIQNYHLGTKIVKEKVNLFVSSHVGKIQQAYPPYSSKAVNGKPLFWWARNNKLSEITLPERAIEVENFQVLSFNEMPGETTQQRIETNISLVAGDFRQSDITKAWNDFFEKTTTFQSAKFRITCSSGTYVRRIVHELGTKLGTGAVALDILRTNVGNFSLSDSKRF